MGMQKARDGQDILKPRCSLPPEPIYSHLALTTRNAIAPIPHHRVFQASLCRPVLKRMQKDLRYSCRGHTGWAGGMGAARGH